METLKLAVTGMSCMGCVNSVKNLIGAIQGIGTVSVDLASGQVDVAYDPGQATPEQIKRAIEDGGYGVAS